MVGSTFVSINRNGRRTLLNISEIASMWAESVDLTTEKGRMLNSDIDPALGTMYTIDLLMTSRREVELQFTTATDRDAVYEQLVAAISPAIVIESSAPPIPMLPEVNWWRFPKPAFPNEVFATEQEYDRAATDAMTDLMIRKAPPVAASLASKPPRKPYTRKPRE